MGPGALPSGMSCWTWRPKWRGAGPAGALPDPEQPRLLSELCRQRSNCPDGLLSWGTMAISHFLTLLWKIHSVTCNALRSDDIIHLRFNIGLTVLTVSRPVWIYICETQYQYTQKNENKNKIKCVSIWASFLVDLEPNERANTPWSYLIENYKRQVRLSCVDAVTSVLFSFLWHCDCL